MYKVVRSKTNVVIVNSVVAEVLSAEFSTEYTTARDKKSLTLESVRSKELQLQMSKRSAVLRNLLKGNSRGRFTPDSRSSGDEYYYVDSRGELASQKLERTSFPLPFPMAGTISSSVINEISKQVGRRVVLRVSDGARPTPSRTKGLISKASPIGTSHQLEKLGISSSENAICFTQPNEAFGPNIVVEYVKTTNIIDVLHFLSESQITRALETMAIILKEFKKQTAHLKKHSKYVTKLTWQDAVIGVGVGDTPEDANIQAVRDFRETSQGCFLPNMEQFNMEDVYEEDDSISECSSYQHDHQDTQKLVPSRASSMVSSISRDEIDAMKLQISALASLVKGQSTQATTQSATSGLTQQDLDILDNIETSLIAMREEMLHKINAMISQVGAIRSRTRP